MRIALCLIKRLGWWCEDMQSFKNYYLVGTIPLKGQSVYILHLNWKSRLRAERLGRRSLSLRWLEVDD